MSTYKLSTWHLLFFILSLPSSLFFSSTFLLIQRCFQSVQSEVQSMQSEVQSMQSEVQSVQRYIMQTLTRLRCSENEFCLKERREHILSPLSLLREITWTFTLKQITRFNSRFISQINSCPCVKTLLSCAYHTHTHPSHTLLLLLCRRGVILPHPI